MTRCDYPDTLSKSLVLTTAAWRAAGIDARHLRSLARSGELVRVRHGVYATRRAVAWAADDPRRCHALLVIAVTNSARRKAVGSHHSAALVHGLDLLGPAPRAVTLTGVPTPADTRPSARGVVFHIAALPPSQVTTCLGAAVTTCARTVVDLGRTMPFMEAVVVADSALRLGKTNKPELLQVVESCARWPGVAQAREAVVFANGLAESALESCARVVFDRCGLEPPRLQVTFRGEGFVFRGDFYWARHRTIAEADGMAKYEDPARARDQIRRDRLLRDAGYKVVHFTWRELFETPSVVVTRIRKAFAAPTPF